MKKIINYAITISAVIGGFIIFGAIGASDYSIDVPIQSTINLLFLGVSMIAPALIRGVLE